MTKNKALIAPINSKGELLLQDRSGHKPPPWGFFGGGIEEGETPIEAVVRETFEELSVKIKEDQLEYLGEFRFVSKESGTIYLSHVYLWRTEHQIKDFTLMEGSDLKYVSIKKARELLSFEGDHEILESIESKIWS